MVSSTTTRSSVPVRNVTRSRSGVPSAEPSEVEGARSGLERRFRPDVQALRAVAVTLVVLYHARVPGLSGGYVGVDVFFVISGFLITGQLLREVAATGRISFAAFYARRARRLLVPATVVVLATLAVASVWMPPLRVTSLATDAGAAALYVLNYRLALQGVQYQNETAPPSALQHFWSLAVEEQFYLLWPLVVAAVAVAVAGRRRRLALGAVLTAVVLGSLAWSQSLLAGNAPMAYFGLQSRAWELALGALVAAAQNRVAGLPRTMREAGAVAGLAAVLVSGCWYTDRTPFPGVTALLPVAGTAAVIAAGCGGATFVERALSSRPVQAVGGWSYPWYLWHWPLLILAPVVAPGLAMTWPARVALSAVALLLAVATHRWIEFPLRAANWARTEWLAVAALLMAVTIVTSMGVGLRAVAQDGGLRASAASGRPSALFAPPSLADPFSGPTSGPVTPGVRDAVRDLPPYPAECVVDLTGSVSPPCLISAANRPETAAPTRDRVVLLGDSHAGQWFAPVQAIAASHGWSTEVLTKAGCPLPDLTITNSALKRTYTECDRWRATTLQRLAGEPPPRLVFVAALNRYAEGDRLAAGWRATLSKLQALEAPVIYLADTPTPNLDVPACLSSSLPSWAPCAFGRSQSLRPDLPARPAADRAAAGLPVRLVVDIGPYLCPGRAASCPAVRGGTVLYRDDSHVTNTAMTLLTPAVRRMLQDAGLPG